MPPLILSATVNTTGTTFVPRTLSVSGGLVVGTPSSSYSTGEFSSGIGSEYITYSPSVASDLKINSNTASSSLSLACSTSYNPSVYFFASTTSIASIYVDNSLTSRPLVFQTPTKSPNAGGTLCLTKDGNVGIGTTSPNLQLTLTGSLLLFNNSSGIHQNIYYNSGWKYSANGYGWAISDIGSGSLAFQMAPNNTSGAGATATVSQPVVITNSGNVGIGTTSPANMLDIVGQYAAQFSGYQVFTTWRDTNDANKGFRIQTAGGNTLFSTDATGGGTYTERMRINSSGNVGIGTNSPSYTLDVAGQLRLANNNALYWSDSAGTARRTALLSGAGNFYFGDIDNGVSSGNLYLLANNSIRLQTNTIDRMIVDYRGLFLTLPTTGNGQIFLGQHPSDGDSLVMKMYRPASTTTYTPVYLRAGIAGIDGGAFAIETTNAAAAIGSETVNTRFVVRNNGNVGIGTTSPEEPLHVKGTAAWVQPIIDSSSSSTGGSAIVLRANQNTWQLASRSSANGGANNGFSIYESLNNAIRLVIAPGGNVGIGTSSPTCSLDVQGSWSTGNGPFLQLKNTSGATPGSFGPGIILSNSVAGKSNFMIQQYQDASSAFSINKYDSPYTSYFAITQTGSVGIGTTSPAEALDVVGNIRAKTSTGSTYLVVDSPVSTGNASVLLFRSNGVNKWLFTSYSVDNRLYVQDADTNDGVYIAQNTTSWVSNSDLRLKNVKGTIDGALDKIQQLNGVRYIWKRESDNPDAKVRVGLIAQDVQAVLPEAVDDDSPDIITDEDTGRVSGGLGVRYTEVVPLLVNAIKELTARVVILESQISSGAA